MVHTYIAYIREYPLRCRAFLTQTKLPENHTLHSGTHLYSLYMGVHPGVPWSQRLSFILYWQILRRESLLIFFIGPKRWEPRKESLWSRPLGTSLSCHQLLTVDSDWRTFLTALWVIWLDGLNIFGDGSGVFMFTFVGMCGERLLYQRILLPGKAKVFVVELAYNSMML